MSDYGYVLSEIGMATDKVTESLEEILDSLPSYDAEDGDPKEKEEAIIQINKIAKEIEELCSKIDSKVSDIDAIVEDVISGDMDQSNDDWEDED